jgi:signal transduction histidine kinase
MRLADFIVRDMEDILAEWDVFAATALPAGGRMDQRGLRDHAPDILRAIALDLKTSQSTSQQDQKAKGRAPVFLNAPHTAAQTHAILRAQAGFSIVQLAAEYRALRASVLRLWASTLPHNQSGWNESIEDMTRFNEAIDQALLESVDFFSKETDRSRNLFLGVLGHDLRNPLETIHATANLLGALRADPVVSQAAARLIRSGARMKNMLDDLLDYNQTTLAGGIHITVADADLGKVFAAEIDDFRSAHAETVIELEASGNLAGAWDVPRLQQVLSNLLTNAFAYGAPLTPIRVRISGNERDIHLAVHNEGPPIPKAVLPHLFEPLKRGLADDAKASQSTHLGLGLFIAHEIAKAHGGDIQVRSDEQETVFTVRLPRRAR